MNPIAAALAELPSAHLSESEISVQTACMSSLWLPTSAPRPNQTHLHGLLAIHQAESVQLFCATSAPIAAQIQRDTIQNP